MITWHRSHDLCVTIHYSSFKILIGSVIAACTSVTQSTLNLICITHKRGSLWIHSHCFFCSHTNPYRQSTGRKSLPLAQCCDRKVNFRFLISHFSGSIIHQDIIKPKWEAVCLICQTWDLVIATSIGKLFLRCACYDMAIRNADDKFRYTITPKDNSSFPYSITKTHICM